MGNRFLALCLVLWALVPGVLWGQSAYDEIQENVLCTASNYMAYPGPTQAVLTPAPHGLKPFYISHYGRHGSRYHTKPSMYDGPYLTLARADSLGKLTPLGRDVMLRLDRIRQDAYGRWGELTPLGAEQHRQIAGRMVERFPEVFEGATDVDARSTTVGRCILSMENFLMELLVRNPRLRVHHNATHRDMDYLNLQDKKLMALKFNKPAKKWYDDYVSRWETHTHLAQMLFSDTAYANHNINATEFNIQLFLVAAIMQNTELGRQVTLYDLFTKEEAYHTWKVGNARWYIGWGAAPVNGGVQPYNQRNLLRRLVSDGDKMIRQHNNRVQLRFGHETVLIGLLALMDVNGCGLVTDDLEQLEPNGWVNYRYIPMAANLQLVFYRRHKTDRDVWFKVLLNENEATLPLPTSQPPYYRWKDFRDYCLKKLNAYEKGGTQ